MNLKERLEWAITPFKNGLTYNVTKTDEFTADQIRKSAQLQEKEWGNKIIGSTNNGNWTTLLGETLVFDILKSLGENPRRPERKNGYSPDWETDKYIYEVKTRNWTTSGTAGEKVLGTMYKYSDIPLSYGKPLKIICVGYQEYELSNGTTKIFGENLSNRKQAFLQLAKAFDIEYVKFSEFAKIEIEKIKKEEKEKKEVHVNNSSYELLPFGCIV